MADKTLIQGAYKAAAAETSGIVEAQGWINIAKQVKNWRIKKKKKQDDAVESASKVLEDGAQLPDQEMKNQTERLKDGAVKYAEAGENGDKTTQALEIKKQEMQAVDLKNAQDIRDRLSTAVLNSEKPFDKQGGEVISKDMIDPYNTEAEQIMKLMSDEANLIEFDCPPEIEDCPNRGRLGYIINDEFMRPDQVAGLVRFKDTDFADAMGLEAIKYRNLGNNEKDNALFPYDSASIIVDDLLNKHDLISVAVDDMFGKGAWYDHATNHIMKQTYRDLGLTEEQITGYIKNSAAMGSPLPGVNIKDGLDDGELNLAAQQAEYGRFAANDLRINLDDGINEEEAEIILKTMMFNPDYEKDFKKELNTYYTQFLKTNYDGGAGSAQLKRQNKINQEQEKIETQNQLKNFKKNLESENELDIDSEASNIKGHIKEKQEEIINMFNSEADEPIGRKL